MKSTAFNEHQPNIKSWLNFSNSKFFRAPAVEFIISHCSNKLCLLAAQCTPNAKRNEFHTRKCHLFYSTETDKKYIYTRRNCFQSHITQANSVCASSHGATWKMWKRYFGGQNDICCDIKISANRVIWKNTNEKNPQQQNCRENHQTFPKMNVKICLISLSLMFSSVKWKEPTDKCCPALLIAAFCCFQWFWMFHLHSFMFSRWALAVWRVVWYVFII